MKDEIGQVLSLQRKDDIIIAEIEWQSRRNGYVPKISLLPYETLKTYD
jgi:hypothetical protein